uniref:Uncharacterized protein n=1 Tax=Solanum lycopersicum TaxID=4081 RepID=A0A3Q7GG40_SOLLC
MTILTEAASLFNLDRDCRQQVLLKKDLEVKPKKQKVSRGSDGTSKFNVISYESKHEDYGDQHISAALCP